MEEDFIHIPVLVDFDQTKPVGWLRILKSALPVIPNYVFSLGYLAKDKQWVETNLPGSIHKREYVGEYELLCVAPIEDIKYLVYLKQIGKA